MSRISDAKTLVADTGIPDNEVAGNVNETGKSDSGSATITIAMYTLPDE